MNAITSSNVVGDRTGIGMASSCGSSAAKCATGGSVLPTRLHVLSSAVCGFGPAHK